MSWRTDGATREEEGQQWEDALEGEEVFVFRASSRTQVRKGASSDGVDLEASERTN